MKRKQVKDKPTIQNDNDRSWGWGTTRVKGSCILSSWFLY